MRYFMTVILCLVLSNQAFARKLILLTGFEPFGGATANASWEAIKNLDNKMVGDAKVRVAQIPVVWDLASFRVYSNTMVIQPDAIISFGEAAGSPVRIESTAHNKRGHLRDNWGNFPKTDYVFGDGAETLTSTLPINALNAAFKLEHIPVMMSDHAGTYLCNEVFYSLMYRPGSVLNPKRGFIHLPRLDSQFKNDQGETVTFDQAMLQHVAEIAVQTAAASL